MAGQMYNAHHDGSALVVTAGLNDGTVYSDDMALAPAKGFAQADINRQFTKISWEVRNGASTALAMRRAYKVAATAPGGPVYVAVSRNALQEAVKGDVWSRDAFLVEARPRPAVDQVQALARLLVEAKRPVVIVGDELWKSGAAPEAIALCERLGVAMAGSGMTAFQYLSVAHPQYVGGRYTEDRPYPFGSADLVVQLGTRDLGGGAIPERPPVNPAASFVAVGLDTNMLGRTQPLDLAVVGDVKQTVKDLADAVGALATIDRLAKIRQDRLAAVTPAIASAAAERLARARKVFEQSPIHPDRLGYELEQGLDRNAIVVTENIPGLAGKNDFLRFGHRPDDKLGIATAGSSLGWGPGAALGIKLGAPDRQVVLSIGDGSVMYSASGFWSFARYQVPVLTIVWNNRNYQTVRGAYARYEKRMAATGHYHGVYLGDPDIDFVKLAESQGVRGQRVTSAPNRPGIRDSARPARGRLRQGRIPGHGSRGADARRRGTGQSDRHHRGELRVPARLRGARRDRRTRERHGRAGPRLPDPRRRGALRAGGSLPVGGGREGARAGRSLSRFPRRARTRRPSRAGGGRPRAGAALHQFTDRRQPQRVDSRARAADRSVSD